MAVNVTDRWHKSNPAPGAPRCREHNLVPTAAHGKGKRWQVRWEYWENGKRHQPRRNFQYKVGKDPEVHADAFAESLRIPPPDPKLTLTIRDVSEEWLRLQNFEDSTYITASSRIRNHIMCDGLGNRLAADVALDPNLIQLWIKDLSLKLASRTVRIIAGYLASILEYARFKDWVPANPLRPVHPIIKLPRIPDKKVIPYTREQLEAIEEYLPAPLRIVPRAGAGIGLRIGEIRGLSPDDIDGDVIHIQRQVRYSRTFKCHVFDLPKGQKTRVVPLAPSVKNFLLGLPSQTVELPWKTPNGKPRKVRIYAVTYGKPWAYETLLNHWERVHDKLGIERLPRQDSFHRLRHTFASRVLNHNVDIRTLAEWLGHKRTSFTFDTYCHFIPSDPEALRRAIDG